MTQTLTPQSRVPDLTLALVGGGEFDLASAQAEKFHILVVYRGVHCPKCQAQLKEIETEFNDLAVDGFSVVALSMDSKDRAQRAKDEWEIETLPIAYGMDISTAKSFGLFISDALSEKEPSHFSEPGIFVVRPDGTLYAQYIQNTPFGRVPIREIASGLKYVAENDYPVRGTSTV